MAADAEPLEILLHLPLLCEDKVPTALSAFCGVCDLLVRALTFSPRFANRTCRTYLSPTNKRLAGLVASHARLLRALSQRTRARSSKTRSSSSRILSRNCSSKCHKGCSCEQRICRGSCLLSCLFVGKLQMVAQLKRSTNSSARGFPSLRCR